MTISEVLPTLKALNRTDKIRAIQFLSDEVAKEEGVFQDGKVYEIFTPYESFEAAQQLQKLLDEKENINV